MQSAESKRKRALEAVQVVQHLRAFATVDLFDELPDMFTEDVHLQQAAVCPACTRLPVLCRALQAGQAARAWLV